MAIKTTGTGDGLRVLTKTVDGEVRVSCSCCEEVECCMYPAESYGVGYNFEDLPDSVVWTNSESGELVYQKLDEPTYGSNADGVILYKSGAAEIDSGDENILYILENFSWVRWTGGSVGGPGICLINSFDGDNIGSDAFEDTFADTYTVEILFGDSAGTYTVTRRTACVWSEFAEGEDFGGVRIIGGSLPDGTMSWSAGAFGGGQADQGFKLGDLNTPVGDYGETGTSETLIIVSEI
jgi:hypothetical protein